MIGGSRLALFPGLVRSAATTFAPVLTALTSLIARAALLLLLQPWVLLADHIEDTATLHDLTVGAQSLDGSSYLHDEIRL